jgi:alanyl-tRNA synthetase
LSDGIVPSNVGTGYLARMVIRRAERLCNSVGVKIRLEELIDVQAEKIGYNNREIIRDIVCAEIERYGETLERGSRKVDQISKDYSNSGEAIPTEKLIELYDSHGIQPAMVKEIAEGSGVLVDIPDDFYSLVAASHEKRQSKKQTKIENLSKVKESISKTKRLYYEEPGGTKFDAKVVEVIDNKDGSFELILDRTLFYPEGGGQPSDIGIISSEDVKAKVTDVQTEGGIIFHNVDENIKVGSTVKGEIDSSRRLRLMRHPLQHESI